LNGVAPSSLVAPSKEGLQFDPKRLGQRKDFGESRFPARNPS
jgi:hypothetical protein